MTIPQSFIQELLARVDVVEVVGRYVALKKGGANFMGLCPFHGEKSPSFSVSPSKQFYHCFGCGKNGNAIGFLMEHAGKSFPDAVEELARDDDLFRAKPLRRLNPARDRFLHSVGNSSVFRFEIGQHTYILDAYLADPKGAAERYEISQQFQSAQLAAHGDLAYWPSDWCVSFKNACVPRGWKSYLADPAVPAGARIVVFAGTPKMSDVLAGGGHTWYRRIGDVRWLHQAWSA